MCDVRPRWELPGQPAGPAWCKQKRLCPLSLTRWKGKSKELYPGCPPTSACVPCCVLHAAWCMLHTQTYLFEHTHTYSCTNTSHTCTHLKLILPLLSRHRLLFLSLPDPYAVWCGNRSGNVLGVSSPPAAMRRPCSG